MRRAHYNIMCAYYAVVSDRGAFVIEESDTEGQTPRSRVYMLMSVLNDEREKSTTSTTGGGPYDMYTRYLLVRASTTSVQVPIYT